MEGKLEGQFFDLQGRRSYNWKELISKGSAGLKAAIYGIRRTSHLTAAK